MRTTEQIFTKQARKSVAKKPAVKSAPVRRGSKRTEEFIAAVMGIKLR